MFLCSHFKSNLKPLDCQSAALSTCCMAPKKRVGIKSSPAEDTAAKKVKIEKEDEFDPRARLSGML
eukprot:395724-Lingulodinium_polyedra.AAC.1